MLPFASIAEVHTLYRRRALSPVEVARMALKRAESLGPALRTFITVTGEEALAAALEAEANILDGRTLRPLEGIPLSVKDIFMTRGIRTTCASPILADWVPAEDADAVRRLKAAGAVLLGKNNMLEFAYGAVHPAFGDCRNPWNPERRTGGSSSGSAAAVAFGIGYGSLGTDTGGSIRIPAAYCGLVGVKPTYGLVSLQGVVPLAWSLDHAGPLARTVADAAILLAVIAGGSGPESGRAAPDYLASLLLGVRGLRIGIDPVMVGGSADPETAALVRAGIAALEDAGASVVEVRLPTAAEVIPVLNNILSPEAAAYHRQWLQTRPQDYSPAVRAKLEAGCQVSAVEYVEAQRSRERLKAECLRVLEQVDLLASGTTPTPAPLLDAPRTSATHDALVSRTGLWNVTGLPALTVPCGRTGDGLPVGLQLTSRLYAEELLFRAAAVVEAAQPPVPWPTQFDPDTPKRG